jgi:hypothetical protein
MTATPLQGASARRRSTNRRRTSTMPYWQQQLRPPQSAPLHRVLPPRSLVLLAGLAMLLAVLLVAAGSALG